MRGTSRWAEREQEARFALEDWALWGSTIVLSIALFSYGVFLWSAFSLPSVTSLLRLLAQAPAGFSGS